MQVLLPVVPGLWTVLFRPETAALSPRMLVTWMLCLNLLFILIYVAIVLAPGWVGRFQQRRYEERVLSGREKFESRKEVMKAREEREKSANGSKSGEKDD